MYVRVLYAAIAFNRLGKAAHPSSRIYNESSRAVSYLYQSVGGAYEKHDFCTTLQLYKVSKFALDCSKSRTICTS